MGRIRDPNRDKALEIWQNSLGKKRLKDIAEELSVPEVTVRAWKNKDKWDEKLNGTFQKNERNVPKKPMERSKNQQDVPKKRGPPKGSQNAKGHGAPKGNRNAVGNRGGSGGPVGNKKAVTTGEYESIWFDTLTEEEQALCSVIDTDTLAQVEEDIRLISIRERRMMERIKKIASGLTEKQRKILQELVKEKVAVPVTHEVTGETKIVTVDQSKMVITEITETEYRAIDDILKLEEALTRIQDKKTRQLALKHSIETADKGGEGDAAAKDHAKRVQEAWANR